MTVACAAGLVAMAAQVAPSGDGAGADATALARRLEALRRRALELADADAAAYGEVLAARAASGHDADARRRRAWRRATEVPLEVVDCARQVAVLAAAWAADDASVVRGDARVAVALAAGAATGAAELVRCNVAAGDLDDASIARAEAWCAEAGAAAGRAGVRV